jgi:hypothetical protein
VPMQSMTNFRIVTRGRFHFEWKQPYFGPRAIPSA